MSEWRPMLYLVMALLVSALVSTLLVFFVPQPPACHQRLDAAQLPPDLCAVQKRLESLSLPSTVDDLGWLDAPLVELDVRGVGATVLQRAPATLRRLHASAAHLRSLPPLGDQVVCLDVRWSEIDTLGDLPSGLQGLVVSDRNYQQGDLPEGLVHLDLDVGRGLQDLESLPRSLRSLVLTGAVRSLEGMPPEIEELSLSVRRLKVADVPERLRRLEIDGPVDLDPEVWPRFLEELILQDYRPQGSLAESFPYLRVLEVQGGTVSATELPPLLEELKLIDTTLGSLTRLPGSLRRVHVTERALGGEVLEVLPSGLEDLTLYYWRDERVPDLRDPRFDLTRLDLSHSKVGELGHLPVSVRDLNLSRTLEVEGALPAGMELTRLEWANHPGPEFPSAAESAAVAKLQELDLSDSPALTTLGTLSPELRVLRVANTGLTTLPEDLPPSLRIVDISDTAISSLASLPDGVVSLTLHRGQVSSLTDLPTSVVRLHFRPLSDGPCASMQPGRR